MPCCGQNREQAKIATPVRPAAQPPVSQPVPPARVEVSARAAVASGPVARVRYTGVAEIVVRGAHSGKNYVFSGKSPERAVSKGDVEGLLRVGLFRRV